MAAKKRRRNRTPQRAASPARQAVQRAEGTGPSRATDPRTRKEEAHRRREAIRRRIAVRRYARFAAVGLVLVGLVAFLVVRSLHNAAENRRREQAQQALLSKASAAAKAAGCTKVRTVPPYPGDDQQHVPTLPALTTYASQPPASGPHLIAPLDSGFFASPPELGMAIHSLEHGAADIWYSPAAPSSEVTQLKSLFGGQDHVIVAPYDYPLPGGQLPADRLMALVAWHQVQYCNQVSPPVVAAFVHAYAWNGADPSAYKGEAPEAGAPI